MLDLLWEKTIKKRRELFGAKATKEFPKNISQA